MSDPIIITHADTFNKSSVMLELSDGTTIIVSLAQIMALKPVLHDPGHSTEGND